MRGAARKGATAVVRGEEQRGTTLAAQIRLRLPPGIARTVGRVCSQTAANLRPRTPLATSPGIVDAEVGFGYHCS
jgi:hypothetical protein